MLPEENGGRLRRIIGALLADVEIFGSSGVFPAKYECGSDGSRILVVTGANASGKTVVGRYLGDSYRDHGGSEFMRIGMALRGRGGIAGAFVFGSEEDDSTGRNSLRAVDGAIRTMRARTTPHLVALDEPDIGLSEDFASALGRKLANFAMELPAACDGLIVISHSRSLIGELLPLNPHCLRMCDEQPTREWISTPQPRTVEELDALATVAIERWRTLEGILATRRTAKRAERR